MPRHHRHPAPYHLIRMAAPESSAPAPPALPPAPLERVNDFPDALSPMLVKELRQGLRTNTFLVLFLLIQGVLALVILTASPIAASVESSAGRTGVLISRIVFCFYSLGILVVQPLRGISSIAIEVRQNTVDLMVLTRLSAWRIVYGKWSSLMSQSALILVAILPYLILRYFFGGMQLFGELALLLYLFAISGALCALTIGISAVGSTLIRGLLVVSGSCTLVILILASLVPGLPEYIDLLSFSDRDSSLAALGVLALAIYAGYFFLELGATAIAPAAENRSTRKRLIGLAVLLPSYWLMQSFDPWFALGAALGIAGLLSIDLFSERAEFPAVVCGPFLRFGILGRLAGRFLYPGWATGALFFLLISVLILGLVALRSSGDREQLSVATAGLGAMLFPAAMIQLFARKTSSRFSTYVSLLLISFLLMIILSSLHQVVKEDLLLWLFAPIPMVLFPLQAELAATTSADTILAVSLVTATVYLVIVLGGAAPRLSALGALESEEDADPETIDSEPQA